MARWTVEQVLAAAPDDSSRSAAKGLVAVRNWSGLGATETLIWGKCQGSGKNPYQVSVDLNGPAFRCSCPSRKFPCKHGVALMLLWAANDGSVADTSDATGFAQEWAAKRQVKEGARIERIEKKAEKLAAGEDLVDPVARAKREEQRSANISAGFGELDLWIADLLRQGLALARSQPYSFWDQMAARMVDSQAPTVGERIRSLGSAVVTRTDWLAHLLVELGDLAALSRAWSTRDNLSPDSAADLRAKVGWARSTDDVIALGTRRGRWLVAGRRQELGDRVSLQRTWLWSQEEDLWGLVLDFAVGSGALPVAHAGGTWLDATVATYPGGRPSRLLLVEANPVGSAGEETTTGHPLPCVRSMTACFELAARMLSENPFCDVVPFGLKDVRVHIDPLGGVFLVHPAIDGNLGAVPIDPSFQPWRLLALVGEDIISVFGEWDGVHLLPLTASTSQGLIVL